MSAKVFSLRQSPGAEPALSDLALALACASGDAGAVGALFLRFRGPVSRYLRRLVGNAADVEDLLQSTFMVVAVAGSKYDPERGAVLTWLFGIATNVVRRHRRTTSRRMRLWSAVADAPVAPAADVPEQAATRVELRRAEQALQALSEDLREAFVLCELEGLSAREAARVVDASEVAVWKRVSKARKAIRAAVMGERT